MVRFRYYLNLVLSGARIICVYLEFLIAPPLCGDVFSTNILLLWSFCLYQKKIGALAYWDRKAKSSGSGSHKPYGVEDPLAFGLG